MAAIYLTIHNPTDTTLVLTGVSVEGVAHSTFHESRDSAGMSHMADFDSLPVPSHDSVVLGPRGLHIMAHGLPRALTMRDSVRVTVRTRSGASLTAVAKVRE
ncbi:MAG: copper chaperone PCu(A)C [Gemmatimonadaceae bacterium]|nr:copper chaperone PCu(A)C [Gemmatimonadaceae bacterium]